MTDNVPTFDVQDIFPNAADPVDEALAQLREPHHLLAEALTALRGAQSVAREIDADPDAMDDDFGTPRGGRHRRFMDEAAGLARIAEVAVLVAAEREATTYPVPTVEETEDPGQRSPVDYDAPQPVQATFQAAIVGVPMGRCGGRAWVWTELHGFIDVTDGVEFDPGEPGVGYMLSGRVAAMTGRHVLGVQGSGTAICLPRVLVGLEPDE